MYKLLLHLLACLSIASAQAPDTLTALVAQLRAGGHVIFIRHPQTNPDQADTDPLHLDNVFAQRHLTHEGRQQARDLGAAFQRLGIPVGRVLCSRFYRAQEAAILLGLGKPESLLDVTEGGLVVSPNENKRRAGALRQLLGNAPTDGKNLIILSHRPNLIEAAGAEFTDLREGEAVVFRPAAEGGFQCIGRVFPPEKWADASAPR